MKTRGLLTRLGAGLLAICMAQLVVAAQNATDTERLAGSRRTRAGPEGDRAPAAQLRLLHRPLRLGQRGRSAHRRCHRRIRAVRHLCGQGIDPRAAVRHRLWTAGPAAAAIARAHAAAAGGHACRRTAARPRPAGAPSCCWGSTTSYGRWQIGPYENEYRKENGRWKISEPSLVRDLHRAIPGWLEGQDGDDECGGSQDAASANDR